MFNIIPIGVNNAFTHKGFNTNFLIEDSSSSLLVDCGTTAGAALASLGRDLRKIDNIYISHLHLDHSGGLVENGYGRKALGLAKTNVYLHESLIDDFWDKLLATAMGTSSTWSSNDFFNFIPVKGCFQNGDGKFEVDKISLQTVKVNHAEGLSCHGIVINEQVFLTTDCSYEEPLLEEICKTYPLKAIWHDCSIAGGFESVHASYKQLAQAPENIKALLHLSHYEDNYQELEKSKGKINFPLLEQGKAYNFS